MLCVVLIVFVCFMFTVCTYTPENIPGRFNLLGNKTNSDSDSDSDTGKTIRTRVTTLIGMFSDRALTKGKVAQQSKRHKLFFRYRK